MSTGGFMSPEAILDLQLRLNSADFQQQMANAARTGKETFERSFGEVTVGPGTDKMSAGFKATEEGARASAREVTHLAREFAVLGEIATTGGGSLRELAFVAISLGTHLGEEGIAGALTKIGTLITGVFSNPIILAIAGIGAFGLALREASTYASQTTQSLEQQKKVLEDVKEEYGSAAEAALKYAKGPAEAPGIVTAFAEEDIAKLEKDLPTRIANLRRQFQAVFEQPAAGRGGMTTAASLVPQLNPQTIKQVEDAFKQLNTQKPDVEGLLKFRDVLGQVMKEMAAGGDANRPMIKLFTEVSNSATEMARQLAQQEVALRQSAAAAQLGYEPHKRLGEVMKENAELASIGVIEAHMKEAEAARGVADANDKLADSYDQLSNAQDKLADDEDKLSEAEGKLANDRRFAAQEQRAQAQQLEQFGPQGAAISERQARLRLEEFNLQYDYEGRAKPYSRYEMSELKRQERIEQGKSLRLQYEEAQTATAEANRRAQESYQYRQEGLSPTGGLGPQAEIAKDARDVGKAFRDIDRDGREIQKAFRDIARAGEGITQAELNVEKATIGFDQAIRKMQDAELAIAGSTDNAARDIAKGGNDVAAALEQLAAQIANIKLPSSSGAAAPAAPSGGGGGGDSGGGGGGAGEGHATGGLIRGPGTPSSDSIPARLSNGEFVINAEAVRGVGIGFLNRLNEQRYASGGLVTLGGGPTALTEGEDAGLASATMSFRAGAAAGFNQISAAFAGGAGAENVTGLRSLADNIAAGLTPALDVIAKASQQASTSSHVIDFRTNALNFTATVDTNTIAAIRASALNDLMYSTGNRPSWFS